MEDKTPPLRLCVTLKDEHNFSEPWLYLNAHAAYIKPGEDSVSTAGYSEYPELRGFEVKAWISRPDESFTCWSVQYADTDLDLYHMESAVKVLRKVGKTMKRLSERYGHPRDIATYLAYAAEGLGIADDRPFLRYTTKDQPMTPAGNRYWEMSTDSLRYWLRDQERDWRKKHRFAIADD